MTLYGLLAALAWALIGALFIARLDAFGNRWLSMKQRESTPPDTTIPDDLVGIAMAETEKWAQDQTLDVIRERFDKLKDWNKVRAACGVAEVSA